MDYWYKKFARELVDKKLHKLREAYGEVQPAYEKMGWIKSTRTLLGMTTEQMGNKVGLDQSRISRLERAELNGNLNISSLRKIAEGLDLEFVYALVPKTSLENMVKQQAEKIADERTEKVNHTMKLEKQELSEKMKEKAKKDLVLKILVEDPKNFWDV